LPQPDETDFNSITSLAEKPSDQSVNESNIKPEYDDTEGFTVDSTLDHTTESISSKVANHIPNQENVEAEPKIYENPNEVKILEIFHTVIDTSYSFRIHKNLISDLALKKLKQNCPNVIKLVAIYGISSVMKKFLNLVFEEEVAIFPESEGVYLFYNPTKLTGVIAFITPDEELFKNGPIKSSNRFVVIIRILTDLCQKIVACISEEIIEAWYYEENGALNPYRPKTHQGIRAKIKEVTVQEPKIDEIRLVDMNKVKFTFFMPNDNIDLFFYCKLDMITASEKEKNRQILMSMPETILKLDHINKFNYQMNELYGKISIRSFDFTLVSSELRKYYEKYLQRKNEVLDNATKNISYVIQEKFTYMEKKMSKCENNIKNLISPLKIDSAENLKKELANMLENELDCKEKYFLGEFVQKYYEMYYKSNETQEFNEIVEILIDEISQDFTFIPSISKWFGLSNVSIADMKSELSKNLKNNKKMDSLDFLKYCEKSIILFIHSPKKQLLFKLLSKPFENCLGMLEEVKIEFKNNCDSILKTAESSFKGKQLNLYKSEFKVEDKGKKAAIELVCTVSETQSLLKEYIKSENISISQIIGLESSVYFVLISDSDKKETHVLRFNPNLKTKEDFEICKSIPDPDAKLAWGSSSNKFIMFHNTNKQAFQGSLYMNKYLTGGIEIDVYSKFKTAISSYYMKKARRLYIIDNSGSLFCRELVNDDCETYIVNSSIEVNDSSKHTPLRPLNGSKFMSIDISLDENIIFLLNEVDIECFDKNFAHIHTIKLSGNFLSFKNVTFGSECFLIVQNKQNVMNCYKVVAPKQETKIEENTKKIEKIINGNPIFDIHHMGIIKFGLVVEDTQIIKGRRSLGYYSISKKTAKVLNYLRGLTSVQSCFDNLGFVDPSEIFEDTEEVEKENLIYAICTRMPIHVASIQNGNLIPLQNGVNNFDEFTRTIIKKDSFADSLTDYIKFGNYEEILENIKDMLVISIIGKQSSGKSYLLNRLAGTRFDVAAERCTEGIWMGIGNIQDTPLIVFDCEGLFTVERSTQEEIKLCLFITSLSDLIILNSDLSSGKHIKGLFDEFASGVDRLKGKNLFKGTLDITYRDVPDSQGSGAKTEFKNFLSNLLETGKKETLFKLFNEDIMNTLYHNFENSLFNLEVDKMRIDYLEDITKKWSNEDNFGLMMKMILMQIFSDDSTSVDIKLFNAQTRKFKALVDSIIINADQANKYLKRKVYNGSIQLGPVTIPIEWILNEFYKDNSDPLKFFKASLFDNKNELVFRRQHNSLYKQFNVQIKKFFECRKSMIEEYYRNQLTKAEEYKEQIDLDIIGIRDKIDIYSNSFVLCPRNCDSCEFLCTNIIQHEGQCDCHTDHICKEICDICGGDSYCSLLNGHKKRHVCKKIAHKCTEKCKLRDCKNDCTYDPGHEGDCRCSSSHPCGDKCKMHKECGQFCIIDITEVHNEDHSCRQKCPYKCIFPHEHKCASLNHFHDLDLIEEEIENYGLVKRHICGAIHKCLSNCSLAGVCSIKTEYAHRTYENKYNKFIYSYVELTSERFSCKEKIPTGEINHGKAPHVCISAKHICDIRCPECNCFCELSYGHDGFHSSSSHRNKECSVYISIDEVFEGVIQEDSKAKTVKYVAGESASPEICDQYCISKGQGHSHPMICKGGDLCMEITDKGFAIHSNKNYKSGENGECFYDFLTCDTYWKKHGWNPPNSKNPDFQKIFSLCNFTCDHPSHAKETQKVCCQAPLFHSFSKNYSDHKFNCDHPAVNSYNIVFIVDCTGSMDSYFSGVQNIIKGLVKRWGNEKNKFAFVGYTDHSPNNGDFPSSNPVDVFPSSKNLNNGDPEAAIRFINNLSTSGGGGNGGEAMIDGLYAAIHLEFQKDASRIYIVIADENPHGSEFNRRSAYPNGCPCNHKWKDILTVMKYNNTDFTLVKLDSSLNETASLFGDFYGENFNVMPLNKVEEMETKIMNKVSQKIENDYVFATKIRT